MKRKNQKSFVVIVTILMILEVTSVFLMYKSSTVKETKLEDVRLRENVVEKNSFAIMLEQNDGTYQESESNIWPTNMAYNSDKSGCIDRNGNKIENGLTFDSTNNLATVSTTGTSYCYLYFDLDKTGPVITNVVDAGDGKITFTVTDDYNEISKYCVNMNSSDTSDCTWYDAVEGTQTTSSIVTDSGDYYVHVTDTLGNIGHSSVVTMEVGPTVGDYLLENPTTGLNTILEGGLYRYQGTSVNNYICFGTSDKDTCTGNTDAYMYRIIGINESGQLKLIKKEALNSTMQWYTDSTTDITWPNSIIYSNINGSLFLANTTYVPSGWDDKIATTTWKYGDITTWNITAANMYSKENALTSIVSAKIGLMYMHDYYYTNGSGATPKSDNDAVSLWMHISNNDTSAPSSHEWTMARYGDSYGYTAWVVYSNAEPAADNVNALRSVRPVFYLISDVQYVSGTGTSSDPFIIQ